VVRMETTYALSQSMSPEAAAAIVNCSSKYQSAITAQCSEKSIRLDSLIGILSVYVRQGDPVTIIAEGNDEAEAAAAMTALFGKIDG